jgi:hypothetical protein
MHNDTKKRNLYAHGFQRIGLYLLLLDLICIVVIYIYTPDHIDAHDIPKTLSPYSLCFPGLFLGLLMIGFSKEKIEDEHIASIRMDSLKWAIVTNYSVLFYCFFFVSGVPMLWLIMLNLLTPLVFFIIRFKWKVWQLNKTSSMEGDAA